MSLSVNELLFLKTGRLATGGTNTTLVDAGVSWVVNFFVGMPLKIIHVGGVEYNTIITSNTATQLTFPALPGAVLVAAGDAYFFLPDIAALLAALSNQGLVYKGTVTAAVPGASFTIATLAGLGAGAFGDPAAPYRAFVMRSAGGAEAAPQGEMAAITSYVTATGLFTPNGPPAFTVNIAVGDEILILHPRLAEIFDVFTNLGTMAAAATADDLSDVTTTSAQAKLRRILLRMSGAGIFSADIQGVARTELDTMLAQLAIYFNTAGAALAVTIDNGGAVRTNLNDILSDLGQMLAGLAGITTWPAAAVPADGVSIAEVLRQVYNDVVAIAAVGVLHEQADVNINDVTGIAPLVFNILNLAAANTRYVVRSLRIKCDNPNPNTITVRLWELINGGLLEVDSFVIDNANFATYHSLMDMFAVPQLAGDNLKVTIESTVAAYAVEGQYCTATATI